jgi:pimeloyl-ACP methyl ester carboxylesterase
VTSALLLAHGAAGSVRANFGPLITTLSRTVPAFGPDFPGSGGTPGAAEPLQLDDLADQLVDAAGSADRFAILGYSMGCAVAVRAALRYPHRVTGLVLTAGAPCIDTQTRSRIDEWGRLADGDRTVLARFILSVMFSAKFLHGLTVTQAAGLLDLIGLTVPEGTAAQVELVKRIDVAGDLPAVSVPTLVIGTKYDRLVTPRSMRRYADGIAGARWAELDSGHAAAVEAPTVWAGLVERFLAETLVPARQH